MFLGVAISVWGGIELENRAQASRVDRIMLEAEKQLAVLRSDLGQMQGAFVALPNLYTASQEVEEVEFDSASKALRRDFEPIENIYYAEQLSDSSWRIAYASPESSRQQGQALLTGLMGQAPNFYNDLRVVPVIDTEQQRLFMVQKVQSATQSNGVVAVEVAVGDLFAHLNQGAAGRLTLLLQSDGETIYEINKGQDIEGFTHSSFFEWGGLVWRLDWIYAESTMKAGFWPGKAAVLVGMLVTLILGWVLWMQQSIARRVQREVVERTNELEQASRRFRLITDNAYDLIAIVNQEAAFEYVNSAYNRVLGFSRRELLGEFVHKYVHKDDAKRLEKAIQEVVAGKPVNEITFRVAHKNGGWVHLEAVMKGLFNSDWTLSNIVIHCRDITSRKKFADELARSEQRFRDFADSSADWLWEVNKDFEFTYVSPGVKGTLGYGADEMISRSQFDTIFGNDSDSTRELILEFSKRHQSYRDLEFWTRTKMGERVCLRMSGVPIFDEAENFLGYRGAATNITANKIDQENMLRLATTDHLTGLLNRNRFMEELERTVALAKRHNTTGVLLFLDMDRFKAVNDTHGHDAGDAIIREFGKVLRKSTRSTDVVARLGGDEFGIIMHNIALEDAQPKVQELIQKISRIRVEYKGANLQVTTSIGMVPFPQGVKDGSQLIISADLAMYRAKEMGRNRLYIDMDVDSQDIASSSVRAQLEWVDRLRDSLEKDDFEMHFQPMLPNSKDEDIIFEALIRLRDENGKLGAPGLFIDAAEHFGLIRELDTAVIERCVRMQAELAAQGMDLIISINLSGLSFGDNEVMKALRRSLDKHKANPTKFIFEVTETAAMRDIGEAKEFVSELRKLGCKFALDDFGVGFSSFYYIKHLEVDYIKIDGSYIRNLHKSYEDRLFVKSLVDLAEGLEIKTVAEFVENEDVLTELKKLNVTYAQGYYINRPNQDITGMYARLLGKTLDSDLSDNPDEKHDA